MAKIEPTEEFTEALHVWLDGARDIVRQKDRTMSYYRDNPTRLELEPGLRFIRVVHVDGSHRSAWAFIDKATGDVLLAASWKKPAKHARGNIFDAQKGLGSLGPYGPSYLR
jgi:hypothetical protein